MKQNYIQFGANLLLLLCDVYIYIYSARWVDVDRKTLMELLFFCFPILIFDEGDVIN